jgi:thiol-disulfide isomerase/thioredoxin
MTRSMRRLANHLVLGMAAAWLIAGPAAAQAPAKKFLPGEPKAVPALPFTDGEGRARSLADFKGRAVLLNIWATWCIPCRKEMPALDRLQASLGGPNFEVVPLSIDRGGRDVIAKFYGEIGIQKLAIYMDTSAQAVPTLAAVGLPTTLIINRAGYEINRFIGPAEWDAPEIAEFLQDIISQPIEVAAKLPQASGRQAGPGPLRRAFQWVMALFSK